MHAGIMYIIVDDDGEPVSGYDTSCDACALTRDAVPAWSKFRIARVCYRPLVPDSVEISDDPRERGTA